jgi:monoamine oxidase
VGGRVATFREPIFAPGLHAEGGAMRIPGNHFLLHAYIKKFDIGTLFPFEMKNKFIYLSGYRGGTTLTYDDFDAKLVKKDAELLKLFPGLKEAEKGKTCDQLFFEAVQPVVNVFNAAYATGNDEATKIRIAYQAVTKAYDKYTLRQFLEEVAGWSFDAIRLFDLGNAHVVFENAFIESWKDAFLSSNTSGGAAGMQQLQGGMDQVPKAFISTKLGDYSLAEDITYGARVTNVADISASGDLPSQVRVDYETGTGGLQSISSSFVIFAVPYGAQRAITKSRPFSPAQEQAIRDVRYVEVTKVLLQYQQRWWEDVFTRKSQGTDGGVVSDLPIRYTMFPKTAGNEQFSDTKRGAIMAAYTFQQDATILGAMSPKRRVRIAAENLNSIFPSAQSLKYLEAGASQVFPSDDLAGGSAFCYFAPGQKTQYLDVMCAPDWADPADPENFRVFFAGEHASYTHGWIHGAMEAGLRCAQQVHTVATSHIQS